MRAQQSPAERHAYARFLARLAAATRLTAPAAAPAHAAAITYGMACLGVYDEPLARALMEAARAPLAGAARAARAAQARLEASTAAASIMAPPGVSAGAGAGSLVLEGSGQGAWTAPQRRGRDRKHALSLAQVAPEAAGPWAPADYASLVWGLGTLGVLPDQAWLEDLSDASGALLAR
jgi:hypothetical protein